MKESNLRHGGKRLRATLAAVALACGLGWTPDDALRAQPISIPNNLPIPNPGGHGATFSTGTSLADISGFVQAQGSNGRSCLSCHMPQDAWSINPGTLQRLFDLTGGTHPVFNPLDANNPLTGNFSTVEGRRAAYSQMMSRGIFRRGGALRSPREWNLIAAEDPHGYANLTRLVHWRRSMPTANFALGSATVNWDGGNSVGTDQLGGLENQARRNVTGGQQGEVLPTFPAPLEPPFDTIIPGIVRFETSLFTAQLIVPGVGNLSSGGARGGPEAMASMPKVAGRFDLFDAWADHGSPHRRQIFRGQELFNTPNANGRSCSGCHNSANNGTNINNVLFDIGTASEAARTPDLPLYTFQNATTGQIRKLTDAGRGNVTGAWNDLGRFKTPTIRGLAARAPYFHNGIAPTLEAVVFHYETQLGFIFTSAQRADLVAFLNAL